MEWNGGAKVFSELFETQVKSDGTIYQTSYIYVISKYISNKRYFKLGSGSRSMKRMNDANTYTIPGEGASRSFRVHFLFFWPISPYKREYAEMIEREGHSVLRDQFPTFSIKFATGNPSEWYLPRYQERFFEYIKGLIAVRRPPVAVAYKFTEKNRMNITRTMKATRKYQKFAVDHDKVLKQIKITKVAQGEEKAKTRGNSQYYRKALVGETFRDDGRLWQIQDIKYSQGLDRYLVDYRPARLTARSSAQDKAGYETRIEEVFEWIGEARLRQLGLLTNKQYWDTLKGSGVTVYIDGNGRPRRTDHDPALPRMIHEARAMLESVTIPVDVICSRGIIDQHIIHVDGPTIQRAGLSGLSELYSTITLDHFLANLTRGWLQSRRHARAAAVITGRPVHAVAHPRYVKRVFPNDD